MYLSVISTYIELCRNIYFPYIFGKCSYWSCIFKYGAHFYHCERTDPNLEVSMDQSIMNVNRHTASYIFTIGLSLINEKK